MTEPAKRQDLLTELDDLVATADTGARKPHGLTGTLLLSFAAL